MKAVKDDDGETNRRTEMVVNESETGLTAVKEDDRMGG